jgi:hypothetical protein
MAGKAFSVHHCRWYDPQPGGKYNCLKGVDIRAHVGGADYGWLARTPCVVSSLTYDPVPCAQCEFPTDDEVAAERAEMDRALQVVLSGKCPECGKDLLRRASPSVTLTACPDGHVSMRECHRIGSEP